MGIQSTYISSVGKDDLGEKALKIAKYYGLDTDYISIHSTLPTGKVNVFLDKKGNPQYTINKTLHGMRLFCKIILKMYYLKNTGMLFVLVR